jgi:SHOCT-like domain
VPDALDDVLRLVAEGRLTVDEAAPIIAALEAADAPPEPEPAPARRWWQDRRSDGSRSEGPGGGGRSVRLEVTENGRTVVNLRLPAGLGEAAMLRVPGLSPAQVERIRGALADGLRGTLLEAGEDGDGVRISID